MMFGGTTTLALAIPVFLLLTGVAIRASVAPFHLAGIPATLGASPLGAGLVLGLVLGCFAAILRDGLESVINHLRRARNEVVWKMG